MKHLFKLTTLIPLIASDALGSPQEVDGTRRSVIPSWDVAPPTTVQQSDLDNLIQQQAQHRMLIQKNRDEVFAILTEMQEQYGPPETAANIKELFVWAIDAIFRTRETQPEPPIEVAIPTIRLIAQSSVHPFYRNDLIDVILQIVTGAKLKEILTLCLAAASDPSQTRHLTLAGAELAYRIYESKMCYGSCGLEGDALAHARRCGRVPVRPCFVLIKYAKDELSFIERLEAAEIELHQLRKQEEEDKRLSDERQRELDIITQELISQGTLSFQAKAKLEQLARERGAIETELQNAFQELTSSYGRICAQKAISEAIQARERPVQELTQAQKKVESILERLARKKQEEEVMSAKLSCAQAAQQRWGKQRLITQKMALAAFSRLKETLDKRTAKEQELVSLWAKIAAIIGQTAAHDGIAATADSLAVEQIREFEPAAKHGPPC